ncbi:MAG: hypothetical protein H7Y12_14575, partial [Sphingobacteriaceae bacterium]|nr:hypothetical protein [Cytophagaceae bacterium]
LSVDVLGATLGIGTQLHGSFRFSDDYRAFDDRHQYLNGGVGIGASFSGPLSIGPTVPHYLSYGTGRGRSMWEFGVVGILRERVRIIHEDIPGRSQLESRPETDWQYFPFILVGYRYTAYSGFLFRINGPIPGLALGWIF